MISRRSLFVGAGALLISAPAIVRSQLIMPIHPMIWDGPTPDNTVFISQHWADGSYFEELANLTTRRSEVDFYVAGLRHHKGETDLPTGELLLKRVNEIIADPREKAWLVKLFDMGVTNV